MTAPRDNSWAYALKPGDKAAIPNRGSHLGYAQPYEIITFSRATATLLIFDEGQRIERRVRKDDLYVRKTFARIEPVTPAVRDANAQYVMVGELCDLRRDDLKKLSSFHLSIMLSAYQAAKAEAAERNAPA